MYQVENSAALVRGHRTLVSSRMRIGVRRTVILLGLTSLFTDVSSEMVSTVLPLYLVYSLGLTPLQFGVVDGVYQGGAALVRVASGLVSDRFRRHKEVAAFGYGLSAVCKPLLMLVGGAFTALGAVVLLDRAGKGIRTAPRDALISLSTPREQLGTAFGVHRAMDTTGAMLGPLAAFALLWLVPHGFNSVFFVSFCVAIIGFAILTLFVENPTRAEEKAPDKPVSLGPALRLLAGARFRTFVLVGAVLGLFTASDGFVYLGLQRRLEFDTGFFPLLYVGTAAVYMLLALPAGRLSDRIGRGRVFLGGYALLVLVYLSLLAPSAGLPGLLAALVLFGGYYAATDGVLMALASAVLPAELRASGLALLVTATSLGRLAASILFGALWTSFGVETALRFFVVALALALPLAAVALARSQRGAVHA